MNGGQSKPKLSPYERLYGKTLPPEKIAEMKFNILGFLRTLLEMDKQYQECQQQKTISGLHKNDNE